MRKKLIIIGLVLVIILTVVLIVKDVTKSSYLKNKGKEPTVVETPITKKIAIIDNGYDASKIKAINTKVTTYSVLDNTEKVIPASKRGTMITSSLINDKYSVNYQDELLIIKGFELANKIDVAMVNKAIEYAYNNKARIIVLPFNFNENTTTTNLISQYQKQGVYFICNANDSKSATLMYPATLDKVISVARTTDKVNSSIKVDTTNQMVCYDNKCESNNNLSITSASVAAYLVGIKDIDKEILNLKLKLGYTISKD